METIGKLVAGAALAGLVALSSAACLAADAPPPAAPSPAPAMTPEQMAEEIQLLKNRLNQLEARQANMPTSVDIDAVVDKVVRDAEARSRLLPGNLSANYTDGKFIIATEDKSFVFHPWVQSQFRGSVNWRDQANSDGSDDTQSGFEVRRLKFGIDGTFFTDFTYLFNYTTQRANTSGTVTNSSGQNVGTVPEQIGGSPVLEEAWVMYHLHDTPWSVRGGQFKDPLSHETLISSKYRDLEASLTTDVFGNVDAFTQGVSVVYDPQHSVRAEVALTDGIRSANTNFEDFPTPGINYDFGAAGRVEYKAFGRWQDYNQLTALGNKADLLVFGLGNDFSQGGSTNTWTTTLDAQYATTTGLMLYGAGWSRYITNNPGIALGGPTGTSITPAGTPGQDTYEYALEAQLSYLVTPKWEPYLRAEYLWVQGTPAGSDNGIQNYSVGLNYYIHGHNVKLSTQIQFLPNGIPFDVTGNDILQNNGKSEIVITEQLQLIL
jgi:hypothetical protein